MYNVCHCMCDVVLGLVLQINFDKHLQYLTLLSLHTITVLPLTTVYFVSEVHCTSNVLHISTCTMLSHTKVKVIHTLL